MPHEIECNKFLPKGPRELTEDEKQREFKRKHGYLSVCHIRERDRERERKSERERVREREKEIARGLRTNQAIYASPYGGPSDRPDDPENDGGG